MLLPSSRTRHAFLYLQIGIVATLSLLLLLWIPSPAPRGAERVDCDLCRQEIEGKYYRGENRTVCSRCYGRYPHCPGCEMPVAAGAYMHKGKKVCAECAKRAGRCNNCRDVLLGRSYVPEGGSRERGFCETCFEQKSKCALCGMPMPNMLPSDGKWICPECLKKADRCSTCDQPILDRFYTIEHMEGQFCRSCYEERSHCDFCGRPVAQGGRRLADGRRSCDSCSSNAVRSLDEALDLLGATVRFLEDDLKLTVRQPFDFVLVDNRQMAFLVGRHRAEKAEPRASSDKVLKELGYFSSRIAPQSPRCSISLLSDLPRTAFLETIAHEYAHFWQFVENPGLEDRIIIEGFAQWVAAEWLTKNGLDSALDRLESRSDPLYGAGYDKMKVLAYRNRRGDAKGAVVEYVRSYGRKPSSRPPAPPSGDAARKSLSQLLPREYLQGDFAFLRSAVLVDPETVRKRSAAAHSFSLLKSR